MTFVKKYYTVSNHIKLRVCYVSASVESALKIHTNGFNGKQTNKLFLSGLSVLTIGSQSQTRQVV